MWGLQRAKTTVADTRATWAEKLKPISALVFQDIAAHIARGCAAWSNRACNNGSGPIQAQTTGSIP